MKKILKRVLEVGLAVAFASLLTVALQKGGRQFFANIFLYEASPYFWSEMVGWIKGLQGANNLSQDQQTATNYGVQINGEEVSGYIWSEGVGWISLRGSDYGVTKSDNGALSGYGWSELAGWIDFDHGTGEAQAYIDSDEIWRGYAWAEGFGWIKFDQSSTSEVIDAKLTLSIMGVGGVDIMYNDAPGVILDQAVSLTSDGTTESFTYKNNRKIRLIAQDERADFQFNGWNFAGYDQTVCEEGSNFYLTCTFDMSHDRIVRAMFAEDRPDEKTLTVIRAMDAADGRVISVGTNDINCDGSDSESCQATYSPRTAQVEVTLQAIPAAGSKFVEWSGGCEGTGDTCTFTMPNENTTVQASFTKLDPVDGSCGPANGQSYEEAPTGGLCATGTASSISASDGQYSWTCQGLNSGTNMTCSATQVVAATDQTLDLSLEGVGGVDIAYNETPDTILYTLESTTVDGAQQTYTFKSDRKVRLSANDQEESVRFDGWQFAGYDGVVCEEGSNFFDTCTFSMANDWEVTAMFSEDSENQKTLTVIRVLPAGVTGTVTMDAPYADEISCGEDCQEIYAPKDAVIARTLRATPGDGAVFVRWDGGQCAGQTTETCAFTMPDSNLSIAAYFALNDEGDADGDGMPNGWESAHGLDPNDPSDAAEDPDNDGLTNLEEYQHQTNPKNSDTDGDTYKDGLEVEHGTDPLDPNDYPGNLDRDGDGLPDAWESRYACVDAMGADADADPDNDGLTNLQEYQYAGNHYDPSALVPTELNPCNSDTDADGYGDNTEIDAGTDPLDAASKPVEVKASSSAAASVSTAGGAYRARPSDYDQEKRFMTEYGDMYEEVAYMTSYDREVVAGTSGPFGDVADDHWAAIILTTAKEEGLIPGQTVLMVSVDGSGTAKPFFRPDDETTRAETAAFLVTAMGLDVPESVSEQPFADVSTQYWDAPFIAVARHNGLIPYIPLDNTFRPGADIARAEFLEMLFAAFDLPDTVGGDLTYTDVSDGDWFAPLAKAADYLNILDGEADGSYRPDDTITRAEMIDAIMKAMALTNK